MERITLLDVPLPSGELWLDTGIIFPFFNKTVKTDYTQWVHALVEISRSSKLVTTRPVREEVNRIFTRWNPKTRKSACGIYRKFFEKHVETRDITAECLGKLSGTDVSLMKRPDGILITSDRLLYESDPSSAVFVSLTALDLGYSHKLQITTKNLPQ